MNNITTMHHNSKISTLQITLPCTKSTVSPRMTRGSRGETKVGKGGNGGKEEKISEKAIY